MRCEKRTCCIASHGMATRAGMREKRTAENAPADILRSQPRMRAINESRRETKVKNIDAEIRIGEGSLV